MAGIKTGKLIGGGEQFGGVLKFRATDTIEQPKNIILDGEYLTWAAWCYDFSGHLVNSEAKPVEGCLEDFLSLATATTEEVLAFVNRRGVLGIDPIVLSATLDPLGPDGNTAMDTIITRYIEPVAVYRAFAKEAKFFVDTAHALRKNIPLGSETIEYFRLTRWGELTSIKAINSLVYEGVSGMAHYWWQCATIKLEMSDVPLEEQSAATNEPIFTLRFGDWGDGQQWDAKNILRGDNFLDRLAQKEQEASNPAIPTRFQRPSPLFNVLAFQLLAAVTLPAGRYFCAECGGLFEPDPNRNKPRKDKKTYCTEGCRHEAEMRMDRERKRKTKVKEPETGVAATNNVPPPISDQRGSSLAFTRAA